MSELPVSLRLVPTLTEVIEPQILLAAPVLTEVVQPQILLAAPVVPAAASLASPEPLAPLEGLQADVDFSGAIAEAMAFSFDPQALMMRRVVQRVERALEARLPDVVDQVIAAHMQALMPRLRQEIDAVVREVITQAFEKEAPLPSPPP